MSEEMVRVRIDATMTLRFSQDRQIPKKYYDEYIKLADANARDSEFEKFGEMFIDTTDVYDSDDYEDLEMTLIGEDGKPLADAA